MSMVIDMGDNADVLTEVKARFNATTPTTQQIFTGDNADARNTVENLRHEAKL